MKKLNDLAKLLTLGMGINCSSATTPESTIDTLTPVVQTPKFITAWFQDDWPKALSSLSRNAKYIEKASPAWYHVHTDGSLTPKEDQRVNDQEFRTILSREGILLYPLLTNVWNSSQPDSIKPVLRNPELRKKHIENIVSLVKLNNYDGVDLNYEGLGATDLGLMADLIDSLAPALRKENKNFVVSLEIIGTSGMSAWQRIGRTADIVNLLAYGKKRDTPSPLDQAWMKDGLERAVSMIPKEKMIQGVPLFGIYWHPLGQDTETWEEITSMLRGLPPRRDQTSLTPWFSFGTDTVFYEDALSSKIKMQIGYDLGIRRFSLWRLGGEDPEIWKVIEEYSKKITQP